VGPHRPLAASQVSPAPHDVLVQRGLQTKPEPMQAPAGDGKQS
jgi:hypothetical protein